MQKEIDKKNGKKGGSKYVTGKVKEKRYKKKSHRKKNITE